LHTHLQYIASLIFCILHTLTTLPAHPPCLLCTYPTCRQQHMSLVTNTAASSTTYTTSAIAPRCCWGCQRGRVPCDAQRPACSRCTHRGLACPGYSATGTLKLKASEHKRPAPISLLVRPYLTIVSSAGATSCKDVASAGTVLGTMEYCRCILSAAAENKS